MADAQQRAEQDAQYVRNKVEEQAVAIAELQAKSEKDDKEKKETTKKLLEQLEDALTDQSRFSGQAT